MSLEMSLKMPVDMIMELAIVFIRYPDYTLRRKGVCYLLSKLLHDPIILIQMVAGWTRQNSIAYKFYDERYQYTTVLT